MPSPDLFEKSVDFLKSVGIPVEFVELGEGTFLPGISINQGRILVDRERLKFPGDVLHEAGHIAVTPPEERATLSDETIPQRSSKESEEMMAIAWSYAACVHLEIDPYFVFHNEGYKGGGSNIVENFREGRTFGVPMLQWCGMTLDAKNAEAEQKAAYPAMLCWLRPQVGGS